MMINIFIFSLLSAASCYATVQDFCVADFKSPQSSSGYKCKDPSTVTVDDFSFSGLNVPAKSSNLTKASVVPAVGNQIPGLNGLGVSMARVDMEIGGVGPIHYHPRGTEMLLLLEGSVTAGFITGSNKVFTKVLQAGDVFVIPQGLLHFAVNTGKGPARGFVSFSSELPGFQQIHTALFGNDLASQLVAQITFLDNAQIKKLKAVFVGRS